MEALLPILTTVGTGLLGKAGGGLIDRLFGGGGDKKQQTVAAAPQQASRNLFQPDQIKQATDKYSTEGTAKWNQILANMGAGGGTGGPDVATQIGSQANQLGTALGQLNTDSGYGDSPMANLDAIMKGVEGGISPKYSVY